MSELASSATGPGHQPGQAMGREMSEQPEVLGRLLDRAAELGAVAAGVAPEPLGACAIVARGSSDHASILGRYLLEVATGRPVASTAPSLHTLYRARVDYRGVLVVGVSQSGATPEVVEVVTALRAAGARVLAVTNDGNSPLAAAAHGVVELRAGPEGAVPATKTVTATLLAFVLMAEGLAGRPLVEVGDLDRLPGVVAHLLADEDAASGVAGRLARVRGLVAVARGYLFAAARESALKLCETTGILADGWSAADLRHGPVAAVGPGLPVLSFRTAGPAGEDTQRLEGELIERGASVIRVNDAPDAELPLPFGLPESLVNIPAVVRGQQLARLVSLQLGIDPDQPLGLAKVTRT